MAVKLDSDLYVGPVNIFLILILQYSRSSVWICLRITLYIKEIWKYDSI